MLMISLTTFLITSPDNNVAPDINKIIIPDLRIRIQMVFLPDPDPNNEWSHDYIIVQGLIHLNLRAGYEYTGARYLISETDPDRIKYVN